MNSSRAAAGSMRPNGTLRSTTSGTPYSVTFSSATAPPRFFSQCGSL